MERQEFCLKSGRLEKIEIENNGPLAIHVMANYLDDKYKGTEDVMFIIIEDGMGGRIIDLTYNQAILFANALVRVANKVADTQ